MRIFNEIWLESFGDETDFKIFRKNFDRKYIKKCFFKPFKNSVYKPLLKIIKKYKHLEFRYSIISNWEEIRTKNYLGEYAKPKLNEYEWAVYSKRELKEFLFYVLFKPYNSINYDKFQLSFKIQYDFDYNKNIWQDLLI